MADIVKQQGTRVYLQPGEKPPEGQQVQVGPRQGRFYVSTGERQQIPSFMVQSGFSSDKAVKLKNEIVSFVQKIPKAHVNLCKGVFFSNQNYLNSQLEELTGRKLPRNANVNGFVVEEDGNIYMGDHEPSRTFSHELGHLAMKNFITNNPDPWPGRMLKSLFDKNTRNKTGFLSEWSKRDKYEFFAESYSAYFNNPEQLANINPEMFIFMDAFVKTFV